VKKGQANANDYNDLHETYFPYNINNLGVGGGGVCCKPLKPLALLSQLYVCLCLNSNVKSNHWAFVYQLTA